MSFKLFIPRFVAQLLYKFRFQSEKTRAKTEKPDAFVYG